MTMKSKKGQAAMEYLMTYGWAILVIVIVLAILAFYLPQLIQTPESCLFSQQGFSCQERDHVLVADASDNVGLTFQLNNQQGKPVIVRNVLCTTAAPGDVTSEMAVAPYAALDWTLSSGGSDVFGNTEDSAPHDVRVPCVTESGASVVLSPNSEFRGHLVIWYEFVDEVPGAPARKATAVLTGNVLPETS